MTNSVLKQPGERQTNRPAFQTLEGTVPESETERTVPDLLGNRFQGESGQVWLAAGSHGQVTCVPISHKITAVNPPCVELSAF